LPARADQYRDVMPLYGQTDWVELIKRDVGGVDVVPRRQPGFEKQYGTAGLAKYDAVEFDLDVAMGAQRVDSHVRVARVGDDLFVFFVPVKCVPFEPHEARDRAVADGGVDACRGSLGAPVACPRPSRYVGEKLRRRRDSPSGRPIWAKCAVAQAKPVSISI
jgi:hypothetical protein